MSPLTSAAGPGDDQAGFSLIELSVVCLLIGVVSAMIMGAFIGLQQSVAANLVRQQEAQTAAAAMAVISKDVRAIADDQVLQLPLLQTMNPSTLSAEVNVDTTASSNAIAGAVSAFTGCPDLVTITQTPANGVSGPGPVTETRTHPTNAASAVCSWPTSGTSAYTSATHVETLVPYATLTFSYLSYVVNPVTATGPLPTSLTANGTSNVSVTLVVSSPGSTGGAGAVTLAQTVPLATYSSYLSNGN